MSISLREFQRNDIAKLAPVNNVLIANDMGT